VRNTAVGKRVKALHDYACQICGARLETGAGPYAEAAHIRPLGRPHNGPDVTSNVLCLCPNDHVLFDYGVFCIADDLSLIGLPGRLRVSRKHTLDSGHLAYGPTKPRACAYATG
jgi:putative restriction endonuclease